MYCDGATILKIYETVLKFISFKRNVRISFEFDTHGFRWV